MAELILKPDINGALNMSTPNHVKLMWSPGMNVADLDGLFTVADLRTIADHIERENALWENALTIAGAVAGDYYD